MYRRAIKKKFILSQTHVDRTRSNRLAIIIIVDKRKNDAARLRTKKKKSGKKIDGDYFETERGMPIARGRPSCRVYRYFWRHVTRARACMRACVVNPPELAVECAVRVVGAWHTECTRSLRELQPLVRVPSNHLCGILFFFLTCYISTFDFRVSTTWLLVQTSRFSRDFSRRNMILPSNNSFALTFIFASRFYDK